MVAKCKCVWPEPDNNIRHAKDQHILNDISYTPKHIHSLHLLCWFPDRGCYFQRARELSVTFIACYFVPDFEMYFFLDQKEDQLIAFLLRRPLLLLETTRYIHHNIYVHSAWTDKGLADIIVVFVHVKTIEYVCRLFE